MPELLRNAGLTVAVTALVGMVIGVAMATSGAVTRHGRVGLTGARLLLAGPGLSTLGMGMFYAHPTNLLGVKTVHERLGALAHRLIAAVGPSRGKPEASRDR